MGRREGEGEAPDRLRRQPTRGLARDMSGMVVEDEFNRGVRRVGRVEEHEELDEFAAAMAFFDQGMDVAGEQVDACHQGQSAVPFILVIAHHGRAGASQWRAIRRGRTDRLEDILQAGKAGAYKAAMAELDERTKAHWQEQIAPKLEDLDEIEDDDEDEPVMHYTADAAGLFGFLLCSVFPDCITQLGSLGIRSLIRAQVLGETLDFQRLEPISRYEVHLDRKFQRAVSMLIRLRELRQFNEAG